jgi:hypothetical protein
MNGENLKPPLCKICNATHWSWQEHKFGPAPLGKLQEVLPPSAGIAKCEIEALAKSRAKSETGSKPGRPPKFAKAMTATKRSRRARVLKAELQAQGLVK